MKLTAADIGKKFTREPWNKDSWFFLLGIKPNGWLVGHDEEGCPHVYENLDFIPYEEPKKKIKIAPALIKCYDCYFLSTTLYSSLEEAEQNHKNEKASVIKWPASDSLVIELGVEG